MSEYMEYEGQIAFHPGYYIGEIIGESGLTQEDFAKKLGTTPKNLSLLIKGEQSLSPEIAYNLSKMLGTSYEYWMNIQAHYDELVQRFKEEADRKIDAEVLKALDYEWFHTNFSFEGKEGESRSQTLARFLQIGSLKVLQNRNLGVNFRTQGELNKTSIIKANALTQIAINLAGKKETSSYSRTKLLSSLEPMAETSMEKIEIFKAKLDELLSSCGIALIVLPSLPKSKLTGATRKIGEKRMIMVTDRRHRVDTFFFTLFHEIGHILANDLGLDWEEGCETKADTIAKNILIPEKEYKNFIHTYPYFDKENIAGFAKHIKRDPSIVLGRLQSQGKVSYGDKELNAAFIRSFNAWLFR